MTSSLDNLIVVLVEPQGDRNIGSVCRTMANFGISRLRLVNPRTDHLSHEARQMAVKAGALLENAEICADLPTALLGCQLAVGTTRRFGKYREGLMLLDAAAPQLVRLAADGQVALVFGREDHGLKTEELDLCQQFITIPTDERLPSMNLSQAVTLCLYELFKASRQQEGQPKERRQADLQAREAMFGHLRQTLLDIGFLNPQNPEHILRTFRRIFGRAGLDERDVRVIRGMLSSIDLVQQKVAAKTEAE